jgi:mannose-6-phosphate isomerase-like protein (cupin superfamily)
MLEQVKIESKFWGFEEIIVNNKKNNYCGKRLTVLQGKSCSFHYHEIKIETFFVIEGCIHLIRGKINDPEKIDSFYLVPGQQITIERRSPHSFTGVEPVNRFLEFSTHDDPDDSYRLCVGCDGYFKLSDDHNVELCRLKI